MKHHPESVRYQKIVYWSDEDQVFIGQCPGLFGGGVHGKDEDSVYSELCQVVDEVLATIEKDGLVYPEPTNRTFSGVFNVRVDPDLHRALAARASAHGDSLNRYVEQVLSGAIARSSPPRSRPTRLARKGRGRLMAWRQP